MVRSYLVFSIQIHIWRSISTIWLPDASSIWILVILYTLTRFHNCLTLSITTDYASQMVRFFNGQPFKNLSRKCTVFKWSDFVSSLYLLKFQAPFYPKEAESKGATASDYGFVFGVYELFVFIASPILGKYMSKFGAKRVFNVGLLTIGSCCIAFGLLVTTSIYVISISHCRIREISFQFKNVIGIFSSY